MFFEKNPYEAQFAQMNPFYLNEQFQKLGNLLPVRKAHGRQSVRSLSIGVSLDRPDQNAQFRQFEEDVKRRDQSVFTDKLRLLFRAMRPHMRISSFLQTLLSQRFDHALVYGVEPEIKHQHLLGKLFYTPQDLHFSMRASYYGGIFCPKESKLVEYGIFTLEKRIQSYYRLLQGEAFGEHLQQEDDPALAYLDEWFSQMQSHYTGVVATE